MRILVLSDSHKNTDRIDQVFERCGHVDQVVFCGDVDDDCDYISYIASPKTALLGVCGNNDYVSDRPYQTVFSLGKLRFYVTHGHKENVSSGLDGLRRATNVAGCAVALFGHTHKAVDIIKDGVRLINPGALSGLAASYALLEVKNDTLLSVEFCSLNEEQ